MQRTAITRALLGVLIVALSAWILHSFLQAVLAACVGAIASWPLYERFRARLPSRFKRSTASALFTLAVAVFVLGPMLFAFVALLNETNAILVQVASADRNGIAAPAWLQQIPFTGPWLVERWQHEVARPGGLVALAQGTDAAALLAWAQSLGLFMLRHVLLIAFTVLILFFLYHEGERLAARTAQVLRDCIGERADIYIDLGTRAVRASVNSMLVVGLFDGFASLIVFAIAGVPHPALWAAITGSLALVPFLGYLAVIALALQLAMSGSTPAALAAFVLGAAVLACGDKMVRPLVARDGTRLAFVWVLLGCLGGFEALGLVGLVIGPVSLAITRELWLHER